MTSGSRDGRRHDIDALRVFCFGTIIIYHSSLIYGTKTWWFNATERSHLIDLIAIGSHPWRMSLLFFISGLVTASLLAKRSMEDIRKKRTRQLLLPFVVGVVFVVPPQVYLSPHNPLPDLSYLQFMMSYVLSGLRLEHMWFLAYLWIYMFIWSLIQPRLLKSWPGISASLAGCLHGAKLYFVPIVYLSVLRLGLYPVFGETLVITNDFYSHAVYFSMFLAGSFLFDQAGFWQEIERQRWVSLFLATIAFLVIATVFVLLPKEDVPETPLAAASVLWSIFQWSVIATLLGFAGRIAHRPNKVIAYLNKSTMTYYIVHQTVIVMLAYYLTQAGLLDLHSFIPLVIGTAIICALIAEAKTIALSGLSSITRYLSSMKSGLRKPLPTDAG